MKKILIWISGKGSNFQAISRACNSGFIQGRIAAVCSDTVHAAGLLWAQQAAIPTWIAPRAYYSCQSGHDATLTRWLHWYQPDILVLAGYMRLISPAALSQIARKCPVINIHPSLLPAHPGLRTHQRVIAQKDTFHGLTIHQVTAELDAGPTLLQLRFPVSPTDTSDSLQQRTHAYEHIAYPQWLAWWSEGKLHYDTTRGLWYVEGQPVTRFNWSVDADAFCNDPQAAWNNCLANAAYQ